MCGRRASEVRRPESVRCESSSARCNGRVQIARWSVLQIVAPFRHCDRQYNAFLKVLFCCRDRSHTCRCRDGVWYPVVRFHSLPCACHLPLPFSLHSAPNPELLVLAQAGSISLTVPLLWWLSTLLRCRRCRLQRWLANSR